MRTVTELVQRRDGVQLPGAGRWTIHRSSFVAVTDRSDRSTRAHGVHGTLVVGDPSPVGATLVLETAHPSLGRLVADSIRSTATPDGFVRWRLAGTLQRTPAEGGDDVPLALDLDFHGVFLHGEFAWAVLRGSDATPRRRGRRGVPTQLGIELDLIAAHQTGSAGLLEPVA